jgi:hypothetical protein
MPGLTANRKRRIVPGIAVNAVASLKLGPGSVGFQPNRTHDE